MTQKQNVIFRYVTRLMLHIPDATIHTLRELMEPGSQTKFAEHIAKLSGTARQFFETEFASKEFEQTKKQVLRRLWGMTSPPPDGAPWSAEAWIWRNAPRPRGRGCTAS